MKAISFLGRGEYEPVRYCYRDHECDTHLFPYAVTRFFTPTTLLVFLTPEAKTFVPKKYPPGTTATHFETLSALHHQEGLVQPQYVDIPNGASPTELWSIFKILADNLDDTEEVVFDITHAFRSLPLLAFIAAAYLRVAKRITLQAMVYGAFEAKQDGKVPVFDLSPFLSLLDWTTATDQFLKTGDAQALAALLYSADVQTQPLAESIKGIAQGLHLLRPLDVMRRAAELPSRVAAAEQAIARSVPPFVTLLRRVRDDYGRFGLRDPEHLKQDRARLLRQLEIAEWYAAKEQIVQALSIAREWVPSLLCYCFTLDALDRDSREAMEELLNREPHVTVKNTTYNWSDVPHGTKLRSVWSSPTKLAGLRNDVLHAGFRRNPEKSQQVLEQTTKIMAELREIARLWHLGDAR